MKRTIYKITVLGWDKYNGSLKKGHKCVLISTRFLDDAKIMTLPAGGKLLYLGLLLRCGDVTSSSIEASHNLLVTFAGGSGQVVDRLMSLLQSLQLVTYEKIDSFYNRIEKERIEKDRIPYGASEKKLASPVPSEPPLGKVLMARYCELWKERYGANPSLMPHHAKQLKTVGEQNGQRKTIELLEAFFKIPDSWVVKKGHDIPTFISNLAIVTRYISTGMVVSNAEARQMDSVVSSQNTLKAIRNGEV